MASTSAFPSNLVLVSFQKLEGEEIAFLLMNFACDNFAHSRLEY